MTPGQIARKTLGPLFPHVGNAYRSFFVSADKFVDAFPNLPPNACLLDVGGGDGYLISRLLERRPDLNVIMTDLAETIGASLSGQIRSRVTLFPRTSAAVAISRVQRPIHAVLLSDVLHHVPRGARLALLDELRVALVGRDTQLIVKDVEPGSVRAQLSAWADIYISGDRDVTLISRTEVIELVRQLYPDLEAAETLLLRCDPPNYMLTFRARSNNKSVPSPSS